MKLKFGYFPCMQDPPRGENISKVLDEAVAQAEASEQTGFDNCFISESHPAEARPDSPQAQHDGLSGASPFKSPARNSLWSRSTYQEDLHSVSSTTQAADESLEFYKGYGHLLPEERCFVTPDAPTVFSIFGTRHDVLGRLRAMGKAGLTEILTYPSMDNFEGALRHLDREVIDQW